MHYPVDEDEGADEDALKRNVEFECHRKAHYNEFKMAQLLMSQITDEDEQEEEDEKMQAVQQN